MLSFETESDFLAACPDAAQYQKANDPSKPCFAVPLHQKVVVIKPWGPEKAMIPIDCKPATHVLLINCAVGEVYPCALAPNGHPVGYTPSAHQPSSDVTAYDSEPVWAVQANHDMPLVGLEGETVAPAGSWICFSETKNVYFVVPEKWESMGYAAI